MIITLGPIQKTTPSFPGDSLVHQFAEMFANNELIGEVHDNGYAPRWAFHINKYRWRQSSKHHNLCSDSRQMTTYGLLFDGAGYDSPEAARKHCENQLTRFEQLVLLI